MVCIKEHLHQYVPTLKQERQVQLSPTTEREALHDHKFHRILLGGDRLTVARARSCQLGRGKSDSGISKLNGLIPVAEDWHAGVILLTVRTLHAIIEGLPVIMINYAGYVEAPVQVLLRMREGYTLPIKKCPQLHKCEAKPER